MNEILRDIINEGKVAVFIDGVLVRTETEEGYDEVVEECHELSLQVLDQPPWLSQYLFSFPFYFHLLKPKTV